MFFLEPNLSMLGIYPLEKCREICEAIRTRGVPTKLRHGEKFGPQGPYGVDISNTGRVIQNTIAHIEAARGRHLNVFHVRMWQESLFFYYKDFADLYEWFTSPTVARNNSPYLLDSVATSEEWDVVKATLTCGEEWVKIITKKWDHELLYGPREGGEFSPEVKTRDFNMTYLIGRVGGLTFEDSCDLGNPQWSPPSRLHLNRPSPSNGGEPISGK